MMESGESSIVINSGLGTSSGEDKVWVWTLLSVIVVFLYSIPMLITFKKRKDAELMPRSPIMTLLCMLYLMIDTVGNIVIFSLAQNDSNASCYMGDLITVICQFGFMSLLFIRMYRIKSVFVSYEEYLKWQKELILSTEQNLNATIDRLSTYSKKSQQDHALRMDDYDTMS
jgi:hypothetical protein